MLKHKIKTLIDKHGIWHLVHMLQVTTITLLFLLIIAMLVIPTTIDNPVNSFEPVNIAKINNNDNASDLMQHTDIEFPSSMWNNLFKPASAIRTRSMDDKTVERIKSQLALQCIMNIGDEQVAYININNKGLRKCKNGDTVQDMFKVIDIQNNQVVLTIIGQTVTLSK
jgi:hypothetical protein